MKRSAKYKFSFFAHNGPGPWPCFFCKKNVVVDWVTFVGLGIEKDALTVHHLDGDHTNDVKENLVAAHNGCHARHHQPENHLGRKRSPETCARISAALKGKRYPSREWDRTPQSCHCGAGPFKGSHGLKTHQAAKACLEQ